MNMIYYECWIVSVRDRLCYFKAKYINLISYIIIKVDFSKSQVILKTCSSRARAVLGMGIHPQGFLNVKNGIYIIHDRNYN